MKNEDLIKQAIVAHFACHKQNLTCDTQLEDSTIVAKDFFEYFLTGNRTETFNKILRTDRYKIKKKLIERYLTLNKTQK